MDVGAPHHRIQTQQLMKRFLQSIHTVDTALELNHPLSTREAAGFLTAAGLVLAAAFLLQQQLLLFMLIVAVVGGLLAFQSPILWISAVVLGYAPILWQWGKEFTVVEAAHAVLFYGGLIWWLFHRIVIARKQIRWSFGGLLFVAVFFQAILLSPLSLARGAEPFILIREITVLGSPLLFIPIAHECDTRFKQHMVGLSLIAASLLLALKNIYMYKQKVISAVYFWQVGSSRAADTFYLVMVLTIIAAGLMIASSRVRTILLSSALFIIGAAATILSFYRTIWVAALVAVFAMGMLLGRKFWKRTVAYGGVALLLAGSGYFLFFQEAISLDVLANSVTSRFSSIKTYGSDISLRNRQAETAATLEAAGDSPIVGSGLATEITYKNLITLTSVTTSWTHNGYAWLMYHFGVLGMLMMLGAYGAFIWLGLRVLRRLRARSGLSAQERFRRRTLAATGVGIIIATMLVSLTINQFHTRECALVLALVWGFLERWDHDLQPAGSGA